MWVTKQLLVHFEFDSRKKNNNMEVAVDQQLVFHVLQNRIYFQQKKETHSGLKQLLSE